MRASRKGQAENTHGQVIDPAVSKLSSRIPLSQLAQLAFFTGAGLPTFFSIARFRSRARGESTSALALSR